MPGSFFFFPPKGACVCVCVCVRIPGRLARMQRKPRKLLVTPLFWEWRWKEKEEHTFVRSWHRSMGSPGRVGSTILPAVLRECPTLSRALPGEGKIYRVLSQNQRNFQRTQEDGERCKSEATVSSTSSLVKLVGILGGSFLCTQRTGQDTNKPAPKGKCTLYACA